MSLVYGALPAGPGPGPGGGAPGTLRPAPRRAAPQPPPRPAPRSPWVKPAALREKVLLRGFLQRGLSASLGR